MEFKELISERRSVRGYDAAIEHDALVEILREAQQAPSWKNQQTSRCYAIETPETLEDFRASALPSFNRNSSAHAALIVTTYVRNVVGFNNGTPANEIGNGWGAYDLGLHDAYLVLAAKNAGYDTLIMGIRDADVIRAKLNIPENEEIMSVIAVGKRGVEPSMRPRKPLDEVVRFV
ncbi:MAG: nitroreductase family protein [Clostridia bacterium]|nr:nitroreductase family protein [Clostridia bacterium]